MRLTRSVTLDLPTDLLDPFEAAAIAKGISLNQAVEAAIKNALGGTQPSIRTNAQDRGAREALTKLKERTTTHMRMLQDDVDGLKRPEHQSPQERIAEYLPTHSDDFAADF